MTRDRLRQLLRAAVGKVARPAVREAPRRVQVDLFTWVDAREGLRPILDHFPYPPERHPRMRLVVDPARVDIPRLDALYALWVRGERWMAA